MTFAPRPLRYDRGRALNAVRSFGVSTEIRPCNGSATTAKQCVPSPPLSASSAEYQPTVDDTPIKEETCQTTEGNSQEPQDSSVVALGHSPTSPGPSPLFDPEATNAEDREHQDISGDEIVIVGVVRPNKCNPAPLSPKLKLQVQEMTKSARNKPHLVDSHNHRYRLDRRNDSVTHWRCVSKGCRKRIHTSNNDPTHTYFDHNNSVAPVGAIIHQSGPHNHLADARYAEKLKTSFFGKNFFGHNFAPSFHTEMRKGAR